VDQYALASEAAHCVTVQEVNEVVCKVNVLLRRNRISPYCFPLAILPPVSLMLGCYLIYITGRHKQELSELVRETNQKFLARGCHW
jgi:hypothetical protein